MTPALRLEGRVVRGVGKAAFFTRIDWVRRQCAQRLGFDPYPGTLNVGIYKKHAAAIEALQKETGIALVPPTEQYCSAKTLPVTVGGIRGALIIPERKAKVHGESIIEIMAPLRLKGALGLRDGDPVEIMVHLP